MPEKSDRPYPRKKRSPICPKKRSPTYPQKSVRPLIPKKAYAHMPEKAIAHLSPKKRSPICPKKRIWCVTLRFDSEQHPTKYLLRSQTKNFSNKKSRGQRPLTPTFEVLFLQEYPQGNSNPCRLREREVS